MRALFRATFVVVFFLLLASCHLLKKKGADEDAGAEAGATATEEVDAAPPAVPEPLAENEEDVVRFPDETPIANVAAVAQRPYNVREAPRTGAIVGGLAKGQAATQIAKREKDFLVTFEVGGRKLMGWVHEDAFSTGPVTIVATPPKCAAGETALFSDGPFCGRVCTKDADCPEQTACKGTSNKWANGKAGAQVTVCTVFHPHDAGAPKPPPAADAGPAPAADAGAPAPADAGTAPKPDAAAPLVPLLDAGGLSILVPQEDIVPQPCPVGFILVNKDKKCHRVCLGNQFGCKQKATQRCIKCQGTQVCAATNDDC